MTVAEKPNSMTMTRIDSNTLNRLKVLAGEKPVARYLRELTLQLSQDNPPSLDDLRGGESLTSIRQRLDRIEAILRQRAEDAISPSIDERIKGKSPTERREIFREELRQQRQLMTEEHITPAQVLREALHRVVSQSTPAQIEEWQQELDSIMAGKSEYIRIPRNMPVSQAIELIKKELVES